MALECQLQLVFRWVVQLNVKCSEKSTQHGGRDNDAFSSGAERLRLFYHDEPIMADGGDRQTALDIVYRVNVLEGRVPCCKYLRTWSKSGHSSCRDCVEHGRITG